MTDALSNNRLTRRFAALKAENRAGLVIYLAASDPDAETSAKLLAGLPGAGADIIELGMPFTDPMADGPAIQRAALRALAAGSLHGPYPRPGARFRKTDAETPIVLMGYYNPIDAYGAERFAHDAAKAGVDGVIVVRRAARGSRRNPAPAAEIRRRLHLPRHPTSDDARLPQILKYAADSSITSPSSGSPEPPPPPPTRWTRRSDASNAKPRCRSRSASASKPRITPPISPASPTPPWSARR
jgi:tryptophan synthase alpha chain